jgi:hypothetical protein
MSNNKWVYKAKTALLMACVGSALGGCWGRAHDEHDGDRRDHEGDRNHHDEHRDDRH